GPLGRGTGGQGVGGARSGGGSDADGTAGGGEEDLRRLDRAREVDPARRARPGGRQASRAARGVRGDVQAPVGPVGASVRRGAGVAAVTLRGLPLAAWLSSPMETRRAARRSRAALRVSARPITRRAGQSALRGVPA